MMKNISLIILSIIAIVLFGSLFLLLAEKNIAIYDRDKLIIQASSRITSLQAELDNIVKDRDNLQILYDQNLKIIKWDDLRDFIDVDELEEFLAEDKTDEQKYIDNSFECEEFSLMLQRNAAQKGYRMSLQMDVNVYNAHMYNSVIVLKPEPMVVFIEPQKDMYLEGPNLDEETR